MSVKLLTEQHLEVLSLKGVCTGSSESTLVKIRHCWKSLVAANIFRENMVLNSTCYCCLCLLLQILIVEYLVVTPPTVAEVAVSNVRMGFISLEQFATSVHWAVHPV